MGKQQEYCVFKDFPEFWYYTKELSDTQRDVIFNSLPAYQQKTIRRTYHIGGWEDLFIMNQIDTIINKVKKDIKFDIIYMKCKVISGKSFYMKKSLWSYINDLFIEFPEKYQQYLFGGIEPQDVNEQTVLILKKDAVEE